MRTRTVILASLLVAALVIGLVPGARADEPPDWTFEQTPPRLSFLDGQVSFWRPGAPDWTQAQMNTPLAPGDVLATGFRGSLELQIGARAFVRAWANTQLGLANLEPDFIQFTLTAGDAILDLRTLDPGRTVEVDTPNAVVTIEHGGYYRIGVAGERSRVMTRRGGRATVTPAGGQTVAITPSEEVVIEGTDNPQLAAYAAPPLDEWDRWNYTRTDRLLDAVSARYVAAGTYGVSDLDPYGTWRVVPTYGTVWVPTGVPVGWAPYSTGSWILDPIYGWTWVDTAPWGWAPYHYGRWCFVDGYWAWAPGPLIVRPLYAPALVAFFGEPSLGVVIGAGGPVGWVALGWGEPVVPWWGHPGFRREPSWRGWGGPRVVNNVVISNTTVVNVQNITVYRNVSVPRAVVAVDRARFGHGPITAARVMQVDAQRLRPLHAGPEISPAPASFAPTTVRGVRPPEESLKRPVVATRPAHRGPEATGAQPGQPRTVSLPPERIVTVPKPGPQGLGGAPRPSFGRGSVERPMTDRTPPPAPPRPGPTSVGPPSPVPLGPPSSTGRSPVPSGVPAPQLPTGRPAGPPPTAGKIPGGAPPGTGHPAGSVPAVRPGVGAVPPAPGPTTAPPPMGVPGQISPQTGRAPGGSPSTGRVPAQPVPLGRPAEISRAPGKGGSGPPPGATPGAPQVGSPGQAAPQPGPTAGGAPAATGRAGSGPPQTVGRPETSRQPARTLPGEPANRLAPRGIPQAPTPPSQPQG